MSKSNYASYIEERAGKHIIEDKYGFATFTYQDEYVYIEDLYVKKEYRNKDIASKYAKEIAKIAVKKGYKKMLGSVSPQANNSTDSIKVLLAYGFKLLASTESLIYFTKNIGE